MPREDTELSAHARSGHFVDLEKTIDGFEQIVNGQHDDLPEQAFYMVGDIEEAKEKARKLSAS